MEAVADVEDAVASRRREAFNEPFFLQWHLTDRCNLACQHCYREELKPDLDAKALRHILVDFVGFLQRQGRGGRIQFSGGEPVLSPYLYDLIRIAKRHHIPSRILSNGTLVTPEVARRLRRAGCRLAQVSLDGLKATHDEIRGPSAFRQALVGIERLREAGIQVTVSMTISRLNAGEALGVARLAAAVADRVHFSRLVPIGNGTGLATESLFPPELRRLMDDMFAFKQERVGDVDFPLRDPLWKAYLNPRPRRCHAVSGCAVGHNGLAIESNGDVYPCRRLPIVVGNVMRQTLHEIWQAPLLQVLGDRDQLKGKCGRCRLRWTCGGCRGVAYAFSGDPLAEDPQCFRKLSRLEKVMGNFSGNLARRKTPV